MLVAGQFAPAKAPVAVPRSGAAAVPAVDLTPWRGLRVASVVVALLAVALYFTLWLLVRSR
jgi:uncharacterized sodium:solute symporter family permease YidK